jgi:predicted nucleic acid-binding protein
MIIVVDASVAAKWFIAEENDQESLELLKSPFEIHAPNLLFLEVDNVLCKLIRRGLLSEDVGFEIHDRILDFPMQIHPFRSLQEEALQLAVRTNRGMYDCIYLSLAEALDCRMVTADRKFFEALQSGPVSRHLLWVADLKSYRETDNLQDN